MRKIAKLIRRARQWREGRQGLRDLDRLFPDLANEDSIVRRCQEELRPHYAQYVREVSTPDMAASLELMSLLYTWCLVRRPRSLLDLGSGFSSFVFRLYAAKHDRDAYVASFDDSTEWLTHTSSFLRANGVETGNLWTWNGSRARLDRSFDLILHDIGDMQVRAETVDVALDHVADDGVVILDDMHKGDYARAATARASDRQFRVLSLRPWTLDRFGRFSSIAFRDRPALASASASAPKR